MAYILIDAVVLKSVSSNGQKFQRGGGGKITPIAVEAVPVTVDVRISADERHGFGASASLSTRASSIDISGAGGSAVMLKLVKLVGP